VIAILESKKGKIGDIIHFVNMLLEYAPERFKNDFSVINILFDKSLIVAFKMKNG